MQFRDLTEKDIEVRVQSVKPNGLILLLYKNARVDMNILDETVGAENWQREHYECKGNLFCRVGIKVGKQDRAENAPDLILGKTEWVWKADCGTESNTEAEKGESSDSFKRACFNWGIGRELYTSPFIWIPADKCNIQNGKCFDRFSVAKINIENKQVKGLQISNDTKGIICYMFGNCDLRPVQPEPEPTFTHAGEQLPFDSDFEECCECHKQVPAKTAKLCEEKYGYIVCSKECKINHEARKVAINGE